MENEVEVGKNKEKRGEKERGIRRGKEEVKKNNLRNINQGIKLKEQVELY